MNILLGDSTQSLKMFRKVMNEIKQICLLLRAPTHAPWIPKSSLCGQVGPAGRLGPLGQASGGAWS